MSTRPYHLSLEFGQSSLKATIWTPLLGVIVKDKVGYADIGAEMETELEMDSSHSPASSTIKPPLIALHQLLDKLASSSALSLVGSIGGTVSTYHLYHLSSPLPTLSTDSSLSELDADALQTAVTAPSPGLGLERIRQPADGADREVTLGWILTSLLLAREGAVVRQEIEMATGGSFNSAPPNASSLETEISDGGEGDQDAKHKVAPVIRVIGEDEVIGKAGEYWSNWGLEGFLPSFLAQRLGSLCQPTDISLSFSSSMDYMVLSHPTSAISQSINAGGIILSPLKSLDCEADEREELVLGVFAHAGGRARQSMRDKYGNGKWSQFSQLARIMPPGGALTLDDKLFSFPASCAVPSSSWARDGVIRFEGGEPVLEYREIRANPRCILESQLLAWRAAQVAVDKECNMDRRLIVSSNMAECAAIPPMSAQIFDAPIYTSRLTSHASAAGSALLALFAQLGEHTSLIDFAASRLETTSTNDTPTPSPPLTAASPTISARAEEPERGRGRNPISRAGSLIDLDQPSTRARATTRAVSMDNVKIIHFDDTPPMTPRSSSPLTPTMRPRIIEIPPSPPVTPKATYSSLTLASSGSGSGSSLCSTMTSQETVPSSAGSLRLLAWPGGDVFPHLVYRAMLVEHQRLKNLLRKGLVPPPPADEAPTYSLGTP